MKVLHVSKFFPPVRGGIESTVHELVEGLNRRGVTTDVLCANTSAQTQIDQLPAGYRVTRVALWGRLLGTSVAPTMLAELRQACRQYHLVHLHMPDPLGALALLAATAARSELKVVLHWHSDVVRQRMAMRFYGPLQEWVLRRADVVIATSQSYAEASPALRRWAHKVAIVPIGLSDRAVRPPPSAIRQRYAGRRIVLAVGRCTYYKGFDVLIDAANALPGDCVVLIAGSPGDKVLAARLRARAQQLTDPAKVVFLGELAEDELMDHFAACDVFCMPSTERSEAFGVAQLEAMRAGRPIVSSHIPGSGVSWVNQDGVSGLVTPAGDVRLLAAALARVLADDALRTRLGHGARSRFEGEFRAELMVERAMSVYRGLGVSAAATELIGS